jgi:hypothetical protein
LFDAAEVSLRLADAIQFCLGVLGKAVGVKTFQTVKKVVKDK